MNKKLKLTDVNIETERLILKPIDYSYANDIFENFTNDITLYMLPKPTQNIIGINEFIERSLNGLNQGNNLQLIIIKKSSSEFLGCIGLHKIGNIDPELGIWLKETAHRNKFGLEAITSLISWAKNNISFEYLKYPVDKRNYASRRIPEQNGGVIMKEYKEKNQKGFELDEVEYWIYK